MSCSSEDYGETEMTGLQRPVSSIVSDVTCMYVCMYVCNVSTRSLEMGPVINLKFYHMELIQTGFPAI